MSFPIQIVDENDQPTGSATKEEAWQGGLYHRIVRVMVEDEAGNILLQKRTETKETYPGCWDNSAAGHVDAGEDYETAALRELAEELGITGYSLIEQRYYQTHGKHLGKKLNRFNKIFSVTVPHDTKFDLQVAEVSDVRWVSPVELVNLVSQSPDSVTDGLVEAYERIYHEHNGD